MQHSSPEHATKVRDKRVRFTFELPPRHVHGSVARREKDPVTFAIGLERLSRPVHLHPVQLDDQLVLRPETIGSEMTSGNTEVRVEPRSGDAMCVKQIRKPVLEPVDRHPT